MTDTHYPMGESAGLMAAPIYLSSFDDSIKELFGQDIRKFFLMEKYGPGNESSFCVDITATLISVSNPYIPHVYIGKIDSYIEREHDLSRMFFYVGVFTKPANHNLSISIIEKLGLIVATFDQDDGNKKHFVWFPVLRDKRGSRPALYTDVDYWMSQSILKKYVSNNFWGCKAVMRVLVSQDIASDLRIALLQCCQDV